MTMCTWSQQALYVWISLSVSVPAPVYLDLLTQVTQVC